MIQVIANLWADMKYNPHVHCIVTEGGFDRKWIGSIHITCHINFGEEKWQYKLLNNVKEKKLPGCQWNQCFYKLLFQNNPEGFVINGEHPIRKKGEGWNMARYIGRYVKHPPIAESRIRYLMVRR